MLAYSLHSILAPRSHFTSIYFFIFLFAYSRSKSVFYARSLRFSSFPKLKMRIKLVEEGRGNPLYIMAVNQRKFPVDNKCLPFLLNQYRKENMRNIAHTSVLTPLLSPQHQILIHLWSRQTEKEKRSR